MRYLFAIALFFGWFGTLFGQARHVDDAALRNAARSASDGDWLTYGLTPGETRFSPLKMIDASNVKRLGLVWSYEAGDGGGDQEATPLVWNNTIFGVTKLEHRVCGRRADGQGEMALGSFSEPQPHQGQNVLRRRESRVGAVPQQDLCSSERWTPAGTRRRNRQAGLGSPRCLG